ncbi:MAG: hypothetical protein ACREIJ_04975 [Nitrospiraceae bacterium]
MSIELFCEQLSQGRLALGITLRGVRGIVFGVKCLGSGMSIELFCEQLSQGRLALGIALRGVRQQVFGVRHEY